MFKAHIYEGGKGYKVHESAYIYMACKILMEVGALQCFAGYHHIGMVPDVENIHRVKLIPARNLVSTLTAHLQELSSSSPNYTGISGLVDH